MAVFVAKVDGQQPQTAIRCNENEPRVPTARFRTAARLLDSRGVVAERIEA